MFLVLLKGFCLIAKEGYQYLYQFLKRTIFKDAG